MTGVEQLPPSQRKELEMETKQNIRYTGARHLALLADCIRSSSLELPCDFNAEESVTGVGVQDLFYFQRNQWRHVLAELAQLDPTATPLIEDAIHNGSPDSFRLSHSKFTNTNNGEAFWDIQVKGDRTPDGLTDTKCSVELEHQTATDLLRSFYDRVITVRKGIVNLQNDSIDGRVDLAVCEHDEDHVSANWELEGGANVARDADGISFARYSVDARNRGLSALKNARNNAYSGPREEQIARYLLRSISEKVFKPTTAA